MRMRDWEKAVKARGRLTRAEKFMIEVVWKSIKHGNKRHSNWLLRKLIELAPELNKKVIWQDPPRES